MDIEEIKRYIHVGSGYVEAARDYLPEYKGIVRRTYIRENKIQLDYTPLDCIESDEGEITFYFHYDSFGDVIVNAEKFLKRPVSEWKNYNKTFNDWDFPEFIEEEAEQSGLRLFEDLWNRRLEFPENFTSFSIRDFYSRAVFLKLVKPDEDFDLKRLIDRPELNNAEFTDYK